MRRTLTLSLVLLAGCARMYWDGDRTLTHEVPAPADSLLNVAAQTLREHGYEPRLVDSGTIVTVPRRIPQYTPPISTAADSSPDSWVLQVRAMPNVVGTGSRLELTGFLIPRDTLPPSDTTRALATIPVTGDRPELLREVERVGNWILEAWASRQSP